MKWNNLITKLIDRFVDVLIIVSIICVIILFINHCFYNVNTTTSPVEELEIDSILKENDKLIIEVESLDSIKNAEIIEVKTLDNDSTLRLFYQLIRK